MKINEIRFYHENFKNKKQRKLITHKTFKKMHTVQDIERRLQHETNRGFWIQSEQKWMRPLNDETKFQVDKNKTRLKNLKILKTNTNKIIKTIGNHLTASKTSITSYKEAIEICHLSENFVRLERKTTTEKRKIK